MKCTLLIKNILDLCFHHSRPVETSEKKDNRAFVSTVMNEIERRRGGVSTSTIENELTAYRSFLSFVGRDMKLCDLSADRMKAYERWLAEKDICRNTSACYMRSLRSVFNRLGLDGRGLFKDIRMNKDQTEKRALQQEEVKHIMEADIRDDSFISRVRDLFIFSIMAMGIPFIDLVHLRKKDIKDGYLVYHRRKTGRQAKVYLEPCLQTIIDKYRCDDSDYLFPLAPHTKAGEKKFNYKSILTRYNRSLVRLSNLAGLKRKVTSYTARHTWATTAYRKGCSLAAISKALTHATPITTQNYLKELDDSEIINVNRQVLGEFYTKIDIF